jgi:hypothetical protein
MSPIPDHRHPAPPSAPADAFLRGVDRRSELRAALLTGRPQDPHGPFELRPATDADLPSLLGVAGRDSSVVPDGPLLLAEVAGTVIAAIGLENRRVIADPFWPTARAVDALQAAAAEHNPWPSRMARLRAALGAARPAGRHSRASVRP